MKKALTIAGSDSGGGAGIQADIKTFATLGVHGASVITSVTAQNTKVVSATFDLPAEHVSTQIDSVMSDIGADAVKTGMLGNEAIVEVVAKKVKEYKISQLVIDPITRAGTGCVLLNNAGHRKFVKKLLPLASLVTPNIPETEALSGISIKNIDDMRKAAEFIGSRKRSVLIKGGHFKGDKKTSLDLLYTKGKFYEFEAERIRTNHTHGTGCVLSAAITAGLAKGLSLYDAVEKGKSFVTAGIRNFIDIGKGTGPVNPVAEFLKDAERYNLICETENAVERLKEGRIGFLIPEIQSNFAAALTDAKRIEDVLGFPGRIIRVGDEITTIRRAVFGGSSHVARIVLTAMRCEPDKRCAINLRYSSAILKGCKKLGLTIDSFSRDNEPKVVKNREGSSLEWGVSQVINKVGSVPDIIYDTGGTGKEPVIRVICRTPAELANQVLKIRKSVI